KMQLDNQKEIAEMQNETQKEIAGIQSATSRQNTKDQVYAQNEMLAYQQKESTARVASIMENTNLSKRSEERFSRNAETDLVCRLLLENKNGAAPADRPVGHAAADRGDRPPPGRRRRRPVGRPRLPAVR